MRFAYADPPYFGVAAKHYADRHESAAEYDRIETHGALIARLSDEFEAWALSLSSTTLKDILPLCPDDIRIGAWCKSFASFKPNVNPGYTWEPVIFRGGRKRGRDKATLRDYFVCPITLKRGFPGAKPAQFCWWVFEFLGAEPEDEFHDVFPGSGAVGRAWEQYKRSQYPLFWASTTQNDPNANMPST